MSNTKTKFIFLFIVNSFLLEIKAQDNLHFFQAKSNIIIEKEGSKEEYTAHIRFNLRDTLWISFTGTLGIEGARMLMTTDSCFIINKLNNTGFASSIYDDNEMIPFRLSIEDWKIILINQVIDTFQNQVEEESKIWKLNYDGFQTRKYHLDRNQLQACKFSNTQLASNCLVQFSEFIQIKNKPSLAMSRKITIDNPSGDNVLITIKYVDYKFNHPMPFQFNFAKYSHAEP